MANLLVLVSVFAVFGGVAFANVIVDFNENGLQPVPDKISLNFTAEQCYTLVRLATVGNDVDMVKMLVSQGCSVNRPAGSNTKEPTPLHIAVINNSLNMVKELLDLGAEVNARATISSELQGVEMKCKYMMSAGSQQ